jgi:hypothetical protein
MPNSSTPPRRRYRSQTKREEAPRAITITDRDLAILGAIFEHRFLTGELLLLLFPPDRARTPTKAIAAALAVRGATFTGAHIGSNLEKRLRDLFHAGLVDRIPRGLGHPFAYALTNDGQKLLRKHGHLAHRVTLAKPSDRLFYVEHTLMIARVRIALGLAVAERLSLEIRISKREGKDLHHRWQWRCVHRAMSNTDSGASRTPIPTEAEHRFRAARTA